MPFFRPDCLEGRGAIVTGASGGIGRAIVGAMRGAGARIVATDITCPDLAGTDILSVAHDVTNQEQWNHVVQECIEQFDRPSILVNCAGIFVPNSIIDETVEGFRRTTEVNQIGVFLGMQTVYAAMAANGGGSIVNISSGAGMGGNAGTLAYAASKFAVRGMTKVAAIEFAPAGIRVNSVHPAAVRTPMVSGALGSGGRVGENTLLKRIMEPDEVANMVVFLASDASSYSTGSEFICDGGMRA
jgi:3alpha(or 20beta)-hydroxysteroid dehydrogenase